jgi:DnaJ-class molecular chaperone
VIAALWTALAAVFGFAGWQVHVHYYPWKRCPRCGGAKRVKSGRAHRDCGRCGSEGRVRRWGAPGGER